MRVSVIRFVAASVSAKCASAGMGQLPVDLVQRLLSLSAITIGQFFSRPRHSHVREWTPSILACRENNMNHPSVSQP